MDGVFLVHYETGEYDDHRTYVVVGYRTMRQAQRHAEKANDWLKSRGLYEREVGGIDRADSFTDNPYDPAPYRFVDYTGAEYYFDALPTPLLDRVPR